MTVTRDEQLIKTIESGRLRGKAEKLLLIIVCALGGNLFLHDVFV